MEEGVSVNQCVPQKKKCRVIPEVSSLFYKVWLSDACNKAVIGLSEAAGKSNLCSVFNPMGNTI